MLSTTKEEERVVLQGVINQTISCILQYANSTRNEKAEIYRRNNLPAIISSLIYPFIARGVVVKLYVTEIGDLVSKKNCAKAKRIFESKSTKVQFILETIQLDQQPEKKDEFKALTTKKGLPQVFIGSYISNEFHHYSHIADISELEVLNDSGDLDLKLVGFA
eukprot:c16299_g1_i1.p1 GENE.c16299_g1_i1~~c16299_g1_i1.p1  ORF type:complete len:163 (+),score=55.52 c16299_g1_i1:60-548(+)